MLPAITKFTVPHLPHSPMPWAGTRDLTNYFNTWQRPLTTLWKSSCRLLAPGHDIANPFGEMAETTGLSTSLSRTRMLHAIALLMRKNSAYPRVAMGRDLWGPIFNESTRSFMHGDVDSLSKQHSLCCQFIVIPLRKQTPLILHGCWWVPFPDTAPLSYSYISNVASGDRHHTYTKGVRQDVNGGSYLKVGYLPKVHTT